MSPGADRDVRETLRQVRGAATSISAALDSPTLGAGVAARLMMLRGSLHAQARELELLLELGREWQEPLPL